MDEGENLIRSCGRGARDNCAQDRYFNAVCCCLPLKLRPAYESLPYALFQCKLVRVICFYAVEKAPIMCSGLNETSFQFWLFTIIILSSCFLASMYRCLIIRGLDAMHVQMSKMHQIWAATEQIGLGSYFSCRKKVEQGVACSEMPSLLWSLFLGR
jgi:hypothetical protein